MGRNRRFFYNYGPYFYDEPARHRSRSCVKTFRAAFRKLSPPFRRREADEFRDKVEQALIKMLPTLERDLSAALKREKWLTRGPENWADPIRDIREKIDLKIQLWYGLYKRRPFTTRIESYEVLDLDHRVYEFNPTVEEIIATWLKMVDRGDAKVDKNFLYLPYRTETGAGEFRVCSNTIIPFWGKMFSSHRVTFSKDFLEHPRHFTATYNRRFGITLTARNRRGVLLDILLRERGEISQREIADRLANKGILSGRTDERRRTVLVSLTAGRAHRYDGLYSERYHTFMLRKEKVQTIHDRIEKAAIGAARKIAQSRILQKENVYRMVKSAEARYEHHKKLLWETANQAFLKASLPPVPWALPFDEERWFHDFELKKRYQKENWRGSLTLRNSAWLDSRNALYDAYAIYRCIFGDIYSSTLSASLTMSHPVVAALAA